MPKAYEAVRDSYRKRGVPLKRAKKLAAMWWNAHHSRKNPWLHEKRRKSR